MGFVVRNFLPATPSEVFEISEHADEQEAHAEYSARAETIRQVGGGTELLDERGRAIAKTVRPLGGGR